MNDLVVRFKNIRVGVERVTWCAGVKQEGLPTLSGQSALLPPISKAMFALKLDSTWDRYRENLQGARKYGADNAPTSLVKGEYGCNTQPPASVTGMA